MVRCLSLWQPWATLMALRLKKNETRSFAIAPGPLAIHAARKPFRPDNYEPQFVAQLIADGVEFDALPYGSVLCVVNVTRAKRIDIDYRNIQTERERLYGNYEVGRVSIETEMLRVLDEPVPLVGRQGLFGWEAALAREITQNMAHGTAHLPLFPEVRQ